MNNTVTPTDWRVFTGTGVRSDRIKTHLPPAPSWRRFAGVPDAGTESLATAQEGSRDANPIYVADQRIVDLANSAMLLRRPLLVKGKPGIGKSTLARAIAWELKLGPPLVWPITSKSNLKDALYSYDAIARLQDAKDGERPPIGNYVRLGPLGTAFLPRSIPRVFLIDEIDKSDIDLPNELLHLFEDGSYEIPELVRAARQGKSTHDRAVSVMVHGDSTEVTIRDGRVECHAFPIVIITSNDERELPAPFLRRCIQAVIEPPGLDQLTKIVTQWFSAEEAERMSGQIRTFFERRNKGAGHIATDQLLNAIHLAVRTNADLSTLIDDILRKI